MLPFFPWKGELELQHDAPGPEEKHKGQLAQQIKRNTPQTKPKTHLNHKNTVPPLAQAPCQHWQWKKKSLALCPQAFRLLWGCCEFLQRLCHGAGLGSN